MHLTICPTRRRRDSPKAVSDRRCEGPRWTRRRPRRPASRSSCSENPPVSTAMVSTPARLAASQSQVESPTITASLGPGLVDGRLHEVGLGLGGLHVARGGPAVHELAGVEQIEVVVHLVGLGRAGQHHRVARRPSGPRSGRARPRAARPPRSAPGRAPSPPTGCRRPARSRPPRRRATPRAGPRPSRCAGGCARSGARSRAAGRLGTRRACAGSWCRRACRPRRGSRLRGMSFPVPSGRRGPKPMGHASRPAALRARADARGDD